MLSLHYFKSLKFCPGAPQHYAQTKSKNKAQLCIIFHLAIEEEAWDILTNEWEGDLDNLEIVNVITPEEADRVCLDTF